jgi:hypothetical protein
VGIRTVASRWEVVHVLTNDEDSEDSDQFIHPLQKASDHIWAHRALWLWLWLWLWLCGYVAAWLFAAALI